MLIDCDACAVRGPACGHCVVTVILGRPPLGASCRSNGREVVEQVDLDQAEQVAIAVLAGSGLVPPLRLVPTATGGGQGRVGGGDPRVGQRAAGAG